MTENLEERTTDWEREDGRTIPTLCRQYQFQFYHKGNKYCNLDKFRKYHKIPENKQCIYVNQDDKKYKCWLR